MPEAPMIPMIRVLPDFRRARYAEWCYSDRLRKYVALLRCEERVAGRWEPFLSEIGRDGVYHQARNGMETLRSLRSQPQDKSEPMMLERFIRVLKAVRRQS